MSEESWSSEFVFIAVSRRAEELGLKGEREWERSDLTANDGKPLFKASPTALARHWHVYLLASSLIRSQRTLKTCLLFADVAKVTLKGYCKSRVEGVSMTCKWRQILGTFGTVFTCWCVLIIAMVNSRRWQLCLLHSNTNTMVTRKETAALLVSANVCLCAVSNKKKIKALWVIWGKPWVGWKDEKVFPG